MSGIYTRIKTRDATLEINMNDYDDTCASTKLQSLSDHDNNFIDAHEYLSADIKLLLDMSNSEFTFLETIFDAPNDNQILILLCIARKCGFTKIYHKICNYNFIDCNLLKYNPLDMLRRAKCDCDYFPEFVEMQLAYLKKATDELLKKS